jgi:hypothetical protein
MNILNIKLEKLPEGAIERSVHRKIQMKSKYVNASISHAGEYVAFIEDMTLHIISTKTDRDMCNMPIIVHSEDSSRGSPSFHARCDGSFSIQVSASYEKYILRWNANDTVLSALFSSGDLVFLSLSSYGSHLVGRCKLDIDEYSYDHVHQLWSSDPILSSYFLIAYYCECNLNLKFFDVMSLSEDLILVPRSMKLSLSFEDEQIIG